MADHQGFAIVTAALHALTQSAVGAASDKPAITLTLYHLAANAAWRNTERPSRNPGGTILTPPLAFDLTYCIAIAGGARLASAQLLGALTLGFANHKLLTHAMLAAVRAVDGDYPELAAPGAVAASPAELVRLTPHYPAPVDAAALWSGLFALPHQPSLHLIASPVLMATGDTPTAPLPVTDLPPNL